MLVRQSHQLDRNLLFNMVACGMKEDARLFVCMSETVHVMYVVESFVQDDVVGVDFEEIVRKSYDCISTSRQRAFEIYTNTISPTNDSVATFSQFCN